MKLDKAILVPGLLCLVLLVVPESRAVDIEVTALFGGAAMLIIDGREQMLKTGQQSPEGVRLIEADSTRAVVSYDGKTRTLALSDRIGSSFQAASASRTHIAMNERRQYVAAGSINGRPVSMLVDTGANVIAINSDAARALGISLQGGRETRVSTASATQPATRVNLKSVQVGPIRVDNVAAVVIEGDHPREILLGMSFLQHVNITENNGLMVLTAKF